MSKNEILAKIEELKSLEELIAEVEQEAESIKDEIKTQMLADGVEELTIGTHIIPCTIPPVFSINAGSVTVISKFASFSADNSVMHTENFSISSPVRVHQI